MYPMFGYVSLMIEFANDRKSSRSDLSENDILCACPGNFAALPFAFLLNQASVVRSCPLQRFHSYQHHSACLQQPQRQSLYMQMQCRTQNICCVFLHVQTRPSPLSSPGCSRACFASSIPNAFALRGTIVLASQRTGFTLWFLFAIYTSAAFSAILY